MVKSLRFSYLPKQYLLLSPHVKLYNIFPRCIYEQYLKAQLPAMEIKPKSFI